jgi:CRISPR-associated protein Cmr6
MTLATNLPRFARVDSFQDVPEHVGVWLDRCYLPESKKEKPLRAALYQRAIEALRIGKPAVETYTSLFTRWKRAMESGDRPRRIVTIQARSRVLLHPSTNASITDGSILLHHTYGVPYLPGSGLKGLARAWMRQTVEVDKRPASNPDTRSDERDLDTVRALFGKVPRKSDPEETYAEAGVIEFVDALWIPEKPKDAPVDWSPLAMDVINPHHTAYYTGNEPPADTNEPQPTHRLTVSPGTRFCVVVEGVTARQDVRPWVDFAVDELLGPALAQLGFGAWTSAGYGRFEMEGAKAAPSGVGSRKTITAPEQWFTANVELDPGSGKLKAKHPSGKTAEVTNPLALELRNGLPEELRERLKKKRSLLLQVRIEPVGNALQITGLKPV